MYADSGRAIRVAIPERGIGCSRKARAVRYKMQYEAKSRDNKILPDNTILTYGFCRCPKGNSNKNTAGYCAQ
jgi:hypothetical protein